MSTSVSFVNRESKHILYSETVQVVGWFNISFKVLCPADFMNSFQFFKEICNCKGNCLVLFIPLLHPPCKLRFDSMSVYCFVLVSFVSLLKIGNSKNQCWWWNSLALHRSFFSGLFLSIGRFFLDRKAEVIS